MSSNEVEKSLGASCPKGGSFYVCHDKPVQFVGCCSVDPCKTATGQCPDDKLGYTSFDKYSFNLIKPQFCVSEAPEVQWYTCAEAKPDPFMGCCSVNPCETGKGCPDGKLHAAKLNPKREQAEPFLTTEQRNANGGGLALGAKIGIAVGAAVGVLLLAGLAFWLWRRRRQQRSAPAHAAAFEPFGGSYPESKAPGSHLSSGYTTSSPSVAGQMPYDPYAQQHQQHPHHPHHMPQQHGQHLYPHYNQGYAPSSAYTTPTPPPNSAYAAPPLPGQSFAAELHSETAPDAEMKNKPTPTELP